jgi:hypothetical protein
LDQGTAVVVEQIAASAVSIVPIGVPFGLYALMEFFNVRLTLNLLSIVREI